MTFHIDMAEVGVFLAILLRLGIVFFLLPIFNVTQVPATLKALLILALTVMLFPIVRSAVAPLPTEPLALAWVAVGEFGFGLVFSLSTLLVFSAFQMAGELISFEMGFGFAQVADPQGGTQETLLSMWFQILATLLFLNFNGHHLILRSIVESFRTIPVGSFVLEATVFQKVMLLCLHLFVIAIKVAAPVMVVLLLTQLGMGLMSKFAPQINILVTSFPITIILGIFFMGASVFLWERSIEGFFRELFLFLRSLTTKV